jgi:type VI protein secretion system component Hcp
MVLKKTMKLMLALLTLVVGVALSPADVEAASTPSVTVQIFGPNLDQTAVTLIGYQSRLGNTGAKREFVDVQFTRAFDNNSQQLAKLSLTDTTIDKIVFTFTRGVGQFLTVTLNRVRLASVQDHTVAAADVPIEQITAVALGTVEYAYRPLLRDGTLSTAPPTVTTWDVQSNKWIR